MPGNIQAIDMERQARIQMAVYYPDRASEDDKQVAEMQQLIDDAKEQVRLYTGATSLEDAPASVADTILAKAAELARRNPYFVGLWNKFWRYELGPIDVALELQ